MNKMSYSYDVKKSLCLQKRASCCRRAFWYGFLSSGNIFSLDFIRILTEHIETVEQFIKYINKYSDITLSLSDISVKGRSRSVYELVLDGKKAEDIIRFLSVDPVKAENRHIDFNLLEKQCCVKSFAAGVFVCAGFLSDPTKGYHLELVLNEKQFAEDISVLLRPFGVSPKITVRGTNYVVYIKNSGMISDFLNIIGASSFCFDYMNAGIEKQIRNNVNRQMNCDNANLDKTVVAAAKQLDVIKKFQKNDFRDLPPELTEIAVLRLENPELSLAELAALCTPPISKSGAAHRLKKIEEKAMIFFGG